MTALLHRLESIRRLVRRRLIAYGICAVLAGGVASFLTVVTLDWLLWLPAVLRLFVALLFFTGFLLAAIHWIVTPLRTPLRVEHIAARLEHQPRRIAGGHVQVEPPLHAGAQCAARLEDERTAIGGTVELPNPRTAEPGDQTRVIA